MEIIRPERDDAEINSVHNTWRKLAPHLPADTQAAWSFALPHDVYSAESESANMRRMLTEAKLKGTRYLILKNALPFGNLDTQIDPARMGQISTGRYARRLNGALHLLERAAGNGRYELRCLEIEPLLLSYVWLHSADRDILCAVGTHSEKRELGRIYEIEENGCEALSGFIRRRKRARSKSKALLPMLITRSEKAE